MDEHQRKPAHTRRALYRLQAGLTLAVSLLLYWFLASILLWWSYDIAHLIREGYYEVNRAVLLVSEMALIVTVLTSVVWFLVDSRKRRLRGWRLGWNVAWKTWIFLIAYVAIVLFRRQLWTPSQGMNDDVMFLPIVGHINAQFLSEFRWLSFRIQVIPFVGLISGGLYFLRARVLRMSDSTQTPGAGTPT
jgi:hypothetical protein